MSGGFLYPEGSLSFTGAPFTQITFRSNAIDFQLDNLKVNSAELPEPSTAWLLVATLPFFAKRLRRRNRSA